MALHFQLELGDERPGDTVVLTGAEAKHAAVVRRVRVDEVVSVGDGKGRWLSGVVRSAAPTEVVIEVTSREDSPRLTPTVTLVQALAKSDRDELAVQTATELGVDEVVPWQAERSVSRWDTAKAAKGQKRWETIAREASKQAHRRWNPDVSELVTTKQLTASWRETDTIIVLDPRAEVRLSDVDATDASRIVLIVGPEGGISSGESEQFIASGAIAAKLGDTVLRTSSAGPAALAVLSVSIGRW